MRPLGPRAAATVLLAGVLARVIPLSAGPANTPARLHFSDQTAAAGVEVPNVFGGQRKRHILEAHGSGAAFFDYDGDGWQDIYLVNGTYLTGEVPDSPPVNRLYRNGGQGEFADVTAALGTGDTTATGHFKQ